MSKYLDQSVYGPDTDFYQSDLYYHLRNFVIIIIILVFIKLFNRLTVGICNSHVNLTGKTVIITGGNSGLGYETARALAARGARIIIADINDASESIKKIVHATNNINLSYKYLNLASFASIRNFAKEINEEEDRLDILVNNAGIFGFNETLTEDGFPYGMQVNYLGPFLLTHLLVDLMKKSAPSRIIFVSSVLAYINCLTVDNIHRVPRIPIKLLRDLVVYANSKFLNTVTANMLARKLYNCGITANSLHPGMVRTDIYRQYVGDREKNIFYHYLFERGILDTYGKTLWEGIQTHLHCAISKELEKTTGKFFMGCKVFPPPYQIRNSEFCVKIWERIENLVRLSDKEKL